MALMDKPDNEPEVAVDTDTVIRLEEDGDVVEENLEYQNLVSYVNSQFKRAKDARFNEEDRWLSAFRDYRGEYDEHVQFTSTEKSQAFIKIAKTKCLAAYGMVTDVLFAGSKFPIGIATQKYLKKLLTPLTMIPMRLPKRKLKKKRK